MNKLLQFCMEFNVVRKDTWSTGQRAVRVLLGQVLEVS